MTAVKVAADGQMVLPREVREELGIKGEEVLEVQVKDGVVQMFPALRGVDRARALFRAHVKTTISVDEFLATRERD
jgi:AbrB family looped-hinge helix DNA binding protein